MKPNANNHSIRKCSLLDYNVLNCILQVIFLTLSAFIQKRQWGVL